MTEPQPQPQQNPLEVLKNPWTRLNTIYYIINKNGQKVRFQANSVQTKFYKEMEHRNIILKGRQMGITTLIQLFSLDKAIFYPNIRVGVVAHTLADAVEFFENKIRYAYQQLPDDIKNSPGAKLISDSRRKLKFENNSSVYVGTNMRGGTYNILHLSEYGILCAQDPKKAESIADGALNTVAVGNFIFIESTAAGARGDFYDRCIRSEAVTKRAFSMGKRLSPLQYKFHFLPWWAHKEYTSSFNVDVPEEKEEYFNKLEGDLDIDVTREHKNWYIQMEDSVGLNMRKEYPSYAAEAFEQTEKGSIFGPQLDKMTIKGTQICELPYYEGIEVNTFWDLGMDDPTAIWFHQRVGAWDHFIKYMEDSNKTLDHYISELKKLPYTYGTHYLPPDGGSRTIIGVSGSAEDMLQTAGFRVRVMANTQKKVMIDNARRALSHSRFEINECSYGLKTLRSYKWKLDNRNEPQAKPLHNWASHGADAYQVFACILGEDRSYSFVAPDVPIYTPDSPAGVLKGAAGSGRNAHRTVIGTNPHIV